MKRRAILILLSIVTAFAMLPASVTCVAGEAIGSNFLSISGSTEKIGIYNESYRIFDILPVKSVEVTVTPRKKLVPCGNPIGIKIETEGVMVVGTSEISGDKSPVENAGLAKGDIILSINGKKINNTEDLREAVSKCRGDNITAEVKRNGKTENITIAPAYNPLDNSYYIGAWVRDSTAGIGTMTWYDPETGEYGALGHSITDVDTGKILDISNGEIVQAEIAGAEKGSKGSPGLLAGIFLQREGTLETNTDTGITGKIEAPSLLPAHEAIQVAAPSEAAEGDAEILCCIEGSAPQSYSITIERIMNNPLWGSKNMIIRITDSRILQKTGGIVQGMSGSPIIQNGKLVGAVTHVLVNDPTRGYGIFIENMLAEAKKIK